MKKNNIYLEDISSYEFADLFRILSQTPNFTLLDSSDLNSNLSNYSIMGVDPFLILKTENNKTSLTKDGLKKQLPGNPFDHIKELHKKYSFIDQNNDFPFCGGIIGYISYEAAKYIADIPLIKYQAPPIPEIILGFYNKCVIYDHLKDESYWLCIEMPDEKEKVISFQDFLDKEDFPKKQNFSLIKQPISNLTKEQFIKTIQKTKKHIKEGDIYQANISHRFKANFTGNTQDLYLELRKKTPSPFGAFLKYDDISILSTSPERFLKLDKELIQARPIKGTCPRGNNPLEDKILQENLIKSTKDQAELLMITDLLRNDIGKVAKTGSVTVPSLYEIEQYSHVSHLVSTIEGKLKKKVSHVDAFKALFPGGSITGAPKIRAMEIINKLETVPRSVYTGNIGYFGFNGKSDFNIAIRTLYTKGNALYFHSGGGITTGSDPESEWQETLSKTQGILETLSVFQK